MKEPLVSVHMLTYNHVSHIAEAIEGVLKQQTDFPFELVIGEDCSTDGTRQIVMDYGRRYPNVIRVITTSSNVGAFKNSKRVTDSCVGKYVAFCEGDDYWHHPLKLQKQVRFLESQPQYGLVHSNYDDLYIKNKKLVRNSIPACGPFNDDDAFCEILSHKRKVMTLTVCLRRQLWNKVMQEHKELTDPSWPMGDTQTWLELARVAKVKYLPESLATHKILLESASRSRDPRKVYQFEVRARDLILHYVNKYECPSEVAREAKAYTALCLMSAAYHARENGTMNALLKDARLHYRRIPWVNLLWYCGSKNELCYHLVKPGLLAMKAGYRLRRTLNMLRSRIKPPVK
jgi:glycosyltransferase involved in cell wall biosynthesis